MPEHITSRKNSIIQHFRSLAREGEYRREKGEFLCDGAKLLIEAISSHAQINCVLYCGDKPVGIENIAECYSCNAELMEYVSPLKNSPGPVFSVSIPSQTAPCLGNKSTLILENVQDPGNVGTVLRTANALGVGTVILTGDCADIYNPKTVRATMGAIFRQRVLELGLEEMHNYVNQNGLKLYGAALSDTAVDIRQTDVSCAAVAIGSEGRGLSPELLAMCNGCTIIPMVPGSESLNAGVAASIVAWEMCRGRLG